MRRSDYSKAEPQSSSVSSTETPPATRPQAPSGIAVRMIEASTLRGAVAGIRCHQEQLFSFIYRTAAAVLKPSAPDLDDAAQEAWLRVTGAIEKGCLDPDNDNMAAYVRKIAVNAAIDQVRSRSESWRPGSGPQELDGCTDITQQGPGDRLDEAGRRLELDRLLDELDENERAMIMLAKDGLSLSEIARALGKPEGTVKSGLHRARDKLQRHARRNRR